MTKPEWGTKRTCHGCNTRFYDMKKKPPVCPKCETVYESTSSPKTRRGKHTAEAEEKPKKVEIEDIEDIEIESDGNDDSIIEDVDELEDDMDFDTVVDIEKDDDRDDL